MAKAQTAAERRARAVTDHTFVLPATLYRHQLKAVLGEGGGGAPLVESASGYVYDLLERMKPRDPVEEMLLGQMLQTHARVVYLSTYAQQQKHLKWASLMYEAADRAANTFRRQMLALAEYRNPRRPRHFTAIGQANIASQQVVQQQHNQRPDADGQRGQGRETENPESDNATNEQGCGSAPSARNRRAAALLPADAGGPGVAAGGSAGEPAVAPEHRPQDYGG